MKTVILAGGFGTRLWPLSREHFPKQFLKLSQLNYKSLFQLSFERALKVSNLKDILVVTIMEQKFLVMGEIEELGYDFPEQNILIEPMARNTLPAITLAMQYVADKALIMPSDHLIEDETQFVNTIKDADELSNDNLILFGINPTSPHTGYGYIKHEDGVIENFKEKPDLETAKKYLEQGYLWNSGIFLFDKNVFMEEIKKINGDYYNYLINNQVLENYSNLDSNSVDYGLLEKTKRIATKPLNIKWSDLGSFDSIYDTFDKDLNNNLSTENVEFVESSNNLVHSDKNKIVSMLGVNDLIVIDTPDALLISKKNKSQGVKDIVNKLKQKGDERAEFHKIVYRPWGSFTVLEDEENYKVKRLTILPGKKISLQRHKHRTENWTVIQGQAIVINGNEELTLNESESTFIPRNTMHRLENKSDKVLQIIETQTGDYFGEDDIERFEDEYGRE